LISNNKSLLDTYAEDDAEWRSVKRAARLRFV